MPKNKKFDKVKEVKRKSRIDTKVAGKSGPHLDKRSHRNHKTTKDYLFELSKECEVERKIIIGISDILTAFDDISIGTKVTSPTRFLEILGDAAEKFDWSACRIKGQGYIELHPEAIDCVSGAGVGRRTDDPNDYVIREHRGRVGLYLKRGLASKAAGVAAVLYTSDAYKHDPEVTSDEIDYLEVNNCSYVLVAVLAHPQGYNSPLTPYRFILNLAGGNREALDWTADEIRQKAKEIYEHSNIWMPVAD